MADWLVVNCLAGWLVGCQLMAGWLFFWLAGYLGAWLVGWLAELLVS